MAFNSKELSASTHVLTLRETFQIARGAADEETVVLATLERDGVVAYGEGAPVDYWGETPHGIVEAIEADGLALLGDDLFAGEAISARLAAWDGPQGAKMALDGVVDLIRDAPYPLRLSFQSEFIDVEVSRTTTIS